MSFWTPKFITRTKIWYFPFSKMIVERNTPTFPQWKYTNRILPKPPILRRDLRFVHIPWKRLLQQHGRDSNAGEFVGSDQKIDGLSGVAVGENIEVHDTLGNPEGDLGPREVAGVTG